jgi:hypothetical protein
VEVKDVEPVPEGALDLAPGEEGTPSQIGGER